MNRLFLSPAHKDHIFSRWGLPSCRRIKNVRVEIYAPTLTIINRRRSSQMRLDVKTILTFTFYAHGLTQGEHKEILTGSLQRLEMNIYFLEMS
jgi:ribonuclease BN (tRNA processing enzyme)